MNPTPHQAMISVLLAIMIVLSLTFLLTGLWDLFAHGPCNRAFRAVGRAFGRVWHHGAGRETPLDTAKPFDVEKPSNACSYITYRGGRATRITVFRDCAWEVELSTNDKSIYECVRYRKIGSSRWRLVTQPVTSNTLADLAGISRLPSERRYVDGIGSPHAALKAALQTWTDSNQLYRIAVMEHDEKLRAKRLLREARPKAPLKARTYKRMTLDDPKPTAPAPVPPKPRVDPRAYRRRRVGAAR